MLQAVDTVGLWMSLQCHTNEWNGALKIANGVLVPICTQQDGKYQGRNFMEATKAMASMP